MSTPKTLSWCELAREFILGPRFRDAVREIMTLRTTYLLNSLLIAYMCWTLFCIGHSSYIEREVRVDKVIWCDAKLYRWVIDLEACSFAKAFAAKTWVGMIEVVIQRWVIELARLYRTYQLVPAMVVFFLNNSGEVVVFLGRYVFSKEMFWKFMKALGIWVCLKWMFTYLYLSVWDSVLAAWSQLSIVPRS